LINTGHQLLLVSHGMWQFTLMNVGVFVCPHTLYQVAMSLLTTMSFVTALQAYMS